MRTNFLISIFFVVCGLTAQTVEKKMFKVNALLPGIAYELAIGEQSTLKADALIGFALTGGSNRSTEFGVFPGLALEFREYVNFERRMDKGKNINGNSGNFFGVLGQYQFGDPLVGELEFNSNSYYNIAAVYGMQRTGAKGFYWSLSFGPAIFVDDFDSVTGVLIDARLGWVINWKKQKK